MHDWPLWMRAVTDDAVMLPQVPSLDDVFVMVAGGPGKHSARRAELHLQSRREPRGRLIVAGVTERRQDLASLDPVVAQGIGRVGIRHRPVGRRAAIAYHQERERAGA